MADNEVEPAVVIKVVGNGPYQAKKPFCDGAHVRTGFTATRAE
ncbi:CDGSH iron-sulfur domain-containing protein [Amycolatopsis japonica]|nr:hypothetical protein [Amycolatopsis japonica]